MEAGLSANFFVRELASRHRVLLLGGLAVIAHGLERKTRDVDIWLEPMTDTAAWVREIVTVMKHLGAGRFVSLQWNTGLHPDEVPADVAVTGVIRVVGFDREVDIFRKPNEMSVGDFDRVWSLAGQFDDGLRLPHEADILITKMNTGRDRDESDLRFLEARVRRRFSERLPHCDWEEAQSLLNRFMDPTVLEAALHNPNAKVQAFATSLLQQFADEGDPYSRDILLRRS